MDRPGSFDEMRIDLKIYQHDQVFANMESIELLMTKTNIITPVVAKILHTMKENEKATAVVCADFVKLHDPELLFKQT